MQSDSNTSNAELAAQLVEARERHDREVQGIREQHEQRVNEIQEQHEQRVQAVREQSEREVEALRRQLADENAALLLQQHASVAERLQGAVQDATDQVGVGESGMNKLYLLHANDQVGGQVVSG